VGLSCGKRAGKKKYLFGYSDLVNTLIGRMEGGHAASSCGTNNCLQFKRGCSRKILESEGAGRNACREDLEVEITGGRDLVRLKADQAKGW